MELRDTVEDMLSADYRARFIAEYQQVCIRRNKLALMLEKYESNSLEFTPNSSIDKLETQLVILNNYISILEERALDEHIGLLEV